MTTQHYSQLFYTLNASFPGSVNRYRSLLIDEPIHFVGIMRFLDTSSVFVVILLILIDSKLLYQCLESTVSHV